MKRKIKRHDKRKRKTEQKGLNFAYDDAFRTIEEECDDALIPLVNYVFHENYDGTAEVKRLRNEHFLDRKDGSSGKRITDSHFEITQNAVTKKYHMECESRKYDGTILLRLFEYAVLTGSDSLEGSVDRLHVVLPRSGLLLLRESPKAPEEAEICIETPEGSASYHIPVIKEADFTVEKIMENRLYFLVPFYIFTYEKELAEIESDKEKMEHLSETYIKISTWLDGECEKGALSSYSHGVIMEASRRVLNKLAHSEHGIKEKVGGIMGGKVMDLEIIRVKHQLDRKIAQIAKLEEKNAAVIRRSQEIEEQKEAAILKGKEIDMRRVEAEEQNQLLQKEVERLRRELEQMKAAVGA